MTPVAAGNTNPVTLISYSFVGLGNKLIIRSYMLTENRGTFPTADQYTIQ